MQRFSILLNVALVIMIVIVIVAGCKRNTSYMNNAVITGYDQRTCASCCGGLMINFLDSTKPYSGNFHDVQNSAASVGISNSDTFPIYLKVNWDTAITGCRWNSIVITSYQRE